MRLKFLHSLKTSLRCFIVREFIHVGFVAPQRIVGFLKNGIHRGRHEFEVGTIQGRFKAATATVPYEEKDRLFCNFFVYSCFCQQ